MILLLVWLTPEGSAAFWPALGAFAGLAMSHLLYWVLTHPVNNFWLAGVELKGAGKVVACGASGVCDVESGFARNGRRPHIVGSEAGADVRFPG